MVSVDVPLPALARVTGLEMEQVTPVAAVQVKFTAPLKPFTDARLMVSVALLPAVTGTMVVFGVSVKSESGLETGFSVVEDGA